MHQVRERSHHPSVPQPVLGDLSGVRFVDLFAGIGGFNQALGAKGLGRRCVFASEIDRVLPTTTSRTTAGAVERGCRVGSPLTVVVQGQRTAVVAEQLLPLHVGVTKARRVAVGVVRAVQQHRAEDVHGVVPDVPGVAVGPAAPAALPGGLELTDQLLGAGAAEHACDGVNGVEGGGREDRCRFEAAADVEEQGAEQVRRRRHAVGRAGRCTQCRELVQADSSVGGRRLVAAEVEG